jgi:hypothetical protein
MANTKALGTIQPEDDEIDAVLPSQQVQGAPSALLALGSIPGTQQAQGGTLGTISPVDDRIAAVSGRMHSIENAKPWGTPENHPGVLGKIGHVLGRIGNIAGDVFAPATMSLIPGTDLNRTRQYGDLSNDLAGLERDKEEEAQTEEEKARTEALKNPREKYSTISTDQGMMRFDPATGEITPLAFNGKPLMPPDKQIAPVLHETDQGLMLVDPVTKQVTPLTMNGKPLMPKAAKVSPEEDLKKQILDAEGKGDAGTVKKLQQQLKDLNPQAEQRFQFSVNEAGQRQGKEDTAQRQTIFKTYQPVMDSAERFNVMTESYEKAAKDHDQQAMLNLLYNHMGMTMGLQKGARMTQDLIREAQQSQPWLQGIKAKFDKDGVLSGVTLSPQQMRQMVSLAQQRYAQDTVKARNEAQYLGANDDGPKRTPNKATINFYMGLANGDAGRAKQLAAEDGWSQ